ncbi:MAG: 4Fe-4S dicluster domain-containing protein [Deltaproteobacteria bacterium]|jgi:sulfhydrogenase subunit beta (sulfur reductase)|nr:4Fe-4S dicluster domain-containing protein [Deltaproteobacteria bacterium]
METKFINESGFQDFVGKLVESRNLVGPVAKRNKFVFGEINKYEDLRLDYDVTLLPPKKLFFPPKQDILKFYGQKGESCIDPDPQILLGVHFYDIKAIDMTDLLFRENNEDYNYLANRECTTIIGSNIQNVHDRAFFGSVGTEVEPKGHDGFLTKIEGGYVFEIITAKAKELLQFGDFQDANENQIKQAEKVNAEVLTKCSEKLNNTSAEINKKVRNSFDSKIWEKTAEDCFSCGSCNIVCPTCYCFDVQDDWYLDQETGVRARSWDGCLKEDFSEVSLGQGSIENFRETRGSRYRHRIMRKATYLNEKLGGPACVGCGRCSSVCTSDIADPVNVINQIMEE